MATVYMLYSQTLDSFYIGSCENFDQRLKQHLTSNFENSFTRRASDWEKYLLIEDLEYLQARQIEGHIKRMKSRKYYRDLKSFPEIGKKLIEKYKAGSPR